MHRAQLTWNVKCSYLSHSVCPFTGTELYTGRQKLFQPLKKSPFFFFFPADLLIHLDWEAKEIFFLEQSEKEFIHAVHVTIYENTVE